MCTWRGSLRIAKRCALAAAVLLSATPAYAQHFSILYHERVAAWKLGAVDGSKSNEVREQKPTDGHLLSFSALGREFHVRVEPNERLLRELPQEVRSALRGVEVWRGELIDRQGSWARLTRKGAQITGVIWDGAELFAIDSSRRLAPYLRNLEPEVPEGPVIYRWRDTAGTLSDELGALVGGSFDAVAGSAPITAAALDRGIQLDLGLVADTELSALEGANVTANMLSRANIVDGIFLLQLGVHINVAEVTVFTQGEDPFVSLTPSALLDELETHRADTPVQRAQDLTHLLTGKNLEGATVGIANRGSVCDERLGTALTQASFGVATDALIMAHELGHNFGAPHDAEPGPCQYEPPSTYIMASNVNSSQEFSACSIEQMQDALASTCLEPIAAGDVELRTLFVPADALIDHEFEATVVVDNPSETDAYLVEVTAAGSNLIVRGLDSLSSDGFVCPPAAVPPSCRRKVLPAGRSATIRVFARTTALTPATLQVMVHTLNDADTANNVVSHVIAPRPFVDLLVEFGSAPDFLRLGEQIEYTATVRNLGNTTATNAVALVEEFHLGLNVVALSSDIGTCTADAFERYFCPLGSLSPGASAPLSLRFRAVDALPSHVSGGYVQGSVSIEATTDQPVYSRVRSTESVYPTVTEAVADLAITAGSLQFVLNSPAEFAITITNHGPDSAHDVRFRHNPNGVPQGLADLELSFNAGECTVSDRTNLEFECRVQTLAAGQSLVMRMRGTAATAGEFMTRGYLDMWGFDPDFLNNLWDTSYSINTPQPSNPPPSTTAPTAPAPAPASTGASSGGGGGAADPLLLVVLALGVSARLKRRGTTAASLVKASGRLVPATVADDRTRTPETW